MTTYDIERIKELLASSDEMVRRSLIVLYQQQTTDERMEGATIEKNNVGFNAFDAKFCTHLAQRLIKGGPLSYSEIGTARRMLMKYAKQLAELANAGAKAGI